VVEEVVPCPDDEEEGGESGRWREVRWLSAPLLGSVGSMLKGVLPAPSRSWRTLVVVVVLAALVVVPGEVPPSSRSSWPSSSPSEEEEGVPDILAASSTMIASASVLRERWDLRAGLALVVAGLLLLLLLLLLLSSS
jgi:hypothetical protein